MKKTTVSEELLKQIEQVAREAGKFAHESDKNVQEFDPTSDQENNWIKAHTETRALFPFRPLI